LALVATDTAWSRSLESVICNFVYGDYTLLCPF